MTLQQGTYHYLHFTEEKINSETSDSPPRAIMRQSWSLSLRPPLPHTLPCLLVAQGGESELDLVQRAAHLSVYLVLSIRVLFWGS